jgi:hypothetical protein
MSSRSAGAVAARLAGRAWERARCWRPRAWPPLRAAAERALAGREALAADRERARGELAERLRGLERVEPDPLFRWVVRRFSAIASSFSASPGSS